MGLGNAASEQIRMVNLIRNDSTEEYSKRGQLLFLLRFRRPQRHNKIVALIKIGLQLVRFFEKQIGNKDIFLQQNAIRHRLLRFILFQEWIEFRFRKTDAKHARWVLRREHVPLHGCVGNRIAFARHARNSANELIVQRQ